MLKLVLPLSLSVLLVSCSSTSFKEQTKKKDMIVDHLSQGKQYVGGEFDNKYNSSGNDGFVLRAIGRSTYPLSQSEHLARSAAIADSKFKLTQSAPTEFKSIVQKAVGNSLGYTGEFNQIETSVTEVKGLKGVDVKDEDVECKVVIEPTEDGGYKNLRECRAIASISISELNKAFDFTLSAKYGPEVKSATEKLLEEQLRKQAINN